MPPIDPLKGGEEMGKKYQECRKCGENLGFYGRADGLCRGHRWEAGVSGAWLRPGYIWFSEELSKDQVLEVWMRIYWFSMATEHTQAWVKYEPMSDNQTGAIFGVRLFGSGEWLHGVEYAPPQPEWFATVRLNAKGAVTWQVEENDREGFLSALLG